MCVCIHIHVCVRMYVHIYIHTCVYVCVCVCVCVCIYTYIYLYTCVCVCVCVCVCMCVCVYTEILSYQIFTYVARQGYCSRVSSMAQAHILKSQCPAIFAIENQGMLTFENVCGGRSMRASTLTCCDAGRIRSCRTSTSSATVRYVT